MDTTSHSNSEFFTLSGLSVSLRRGDASFPVGTTSRSNERETWYQYKGTLQLSSGDGLRVAVAGADYKLRLTSEGHWSGDSSFLHCGHIVNTWSNLTLFAGHRFGLTVVCEDQGPEGVA